MTVRRGLDRAPQNARRKRRRFELKTALAAGGTATAYWCYWDRSANSGDGGWTASSKEFTVTDVDGDKAGGVGAQGWCDYYWADNGDVWYVTWIQPAATHIKFTLSGALDYTDGTMSVTGVTVISPPGGVLLSTPSTIENATYAWKAASGAKGEAICDNGTWRCYQLNQACS